MIPSPSIWDSEIQPSCRTMWTLSYNFASEIRSRLMRSTGILLNYCGRHTLRALYEYLVWVQFCLAWETDEIWFWMSIPAWASSSPFYHILNACELRHLLDKVPCGATSLHQATPLLSPICKNIHFWAIPCRIFRPKEVSARSTTDSQQRLSPTIGRILVANTLPSAANKLLLF